MSRTRLPNRRAAAAVKFEHEGHRYRGTIGFDRNGRPLEVFLTNGRPGTGLETACRGTAIAASLALQHGTLVQTLWHAMTRLDDGSPAGPLGVLLDTLAEGQVRA
jgi:hypothetical protein